MDPVIDTTLRTALAALFAAAAGHKLRDLGRFRVTLADYRLLPAGLVPVAAGLVVAAEAAVAACLVVASRRTAGLVGAAVLLGVYAAAVGVNLARGRRDLDCGCAGPAVRRPIGGWMVARNAALASVALAALGPVHVRPLVWVDALTVVGATAVLAALYSTLDRLAAQAPARARLRGAA